MSCVTHGADEVVIFLVVIEVFTPEGIGNVVRTVLDIEAVCISRIGLNTVSSMKR